MNGGRFSSSARTRMRSRTAAQMSIAAANAATYVADAAGLRASSRKLTRKMRGIRRVYQGTASVEEEQDARATLSDLLAEEDGKEQS